jgi:hypothetical protein
MRGVVSSLCVYKNRFSLLLISDLCFLAFQDWPLERIIMSSSDSFFITHKWIHHYHRPFIFYSALQPRSDLHFLSVFHLTVRDLLSD